MTPRRARPWLRLGVSAAMFAGLLLFVPVAQLRAGLAAVSPQVFAASLAVFMAGHVAAALKWRLLQGGHAGVSTTSLLRAHFFGVVANLWLPGVVGGDVVRAGAVFRDARRPAVVGVASVVDRLVDSVGLVALAALGMLIVGPPIPGAGSLLAGAGLVGAMAAVAGVIGFRLLRRHAKSAALKALVDAMVMIGERPLAVAAALGISMAVQTAFIFVNMGLGHAVGMTAPAGAWFVAWPLAKIAALLPVSAAGFGVREAALVALMRPWGDPAADVMAAGLLWQAVFLGGGVLGWVVTSLLPDRPVLERRPLRSSVE